MSSEKSKLASRQEETPPPPSVSVIDDYIESLLKVMSKLHEAEDELKTSDKVQELEDGAEPDLCFQHLPITSLHAEVHPPPPRREKLVFRQFSQKKVSRNVPMGQVSD